MFASKHRKYKLFPLVNRRVVPGLSRLSKSLCVQSLCAFFLPYLLAIAILRSWCTKPLALSAGSSLINLVTLCFLEGGARNFSWLAFLGSHPNSFRKWPSLRSLFLPVQARSWKERSGAGWDRTGRDGPHLGTWMGPKHCKTKHMATLEGTTSDPGWDLDGPRIGPRRGSGWHPPETVTDF